MQKSSLPKNDKNDATTLSLGVRQKERGGLHTTDPETTGIVSTFPYIYTRLPPL